MPDKILRDWVLDSDLSLKELQTLLLSLRDGDGLRPADPSKQITARIRDVILYGVFPGAEERSWSTGLTVATGMAVNANTYSVRFYVLIADACRILGKCHLDQAIREWFHRSGQILWDGLSQ